MDIVLRSDRPTGAGRRLVDLPLKFNGTVATNMRFVSSPFVINKERRVRVNESRRYEVT